MARYIARLDPPYLRIDEPGWMWSWSGRKVLQVFGEHEYHSRFAAVAYNPPNSDWILPLPRNVQPDWYKHADFANSLLGKSLWTFASGITASDFEWTAVGGEVNYPSNKWIVLPHVPEGVVSLDTTNYAALETLTGVDVGHFKTVAMCGQTPLGGSIAENYHPAFQSGHLPPPYDRLVFGWGRLCFVLTANTYHFCESVDGTRQSWRLLAKGQFGDVGGRWAGWYRLPNRASMIAHDIARLTANTLVAIPVGVDEVLLHFRGGAPVPVRIEGGLRVRNDVWWIGAEPKQHVLYQAQLVTYGDLELPAGPVVGGPYHFDLADYAPSAASKFRAWSVMAQQPNGSDVTRTITQNSDTAASSFSNQQIVIELTDDQGNLWASNGTRNKGGVRVKLYPGNPAPNGRYLTPQFRLAEVRFPAVLTTRPNNLLSLTDTQFAGWMWEGSLRDPLSVKGELRFWDESSALLAAAGLDHRDSFPIEIWSDDNADGAPDTLRLVGWVTDPQLTIHATEGQTLPGGGTRANPLQYYALGFEGVLVRAQDRWEFPPQMINPEATYITHYGAIGEVLGSKGFNTADAAKVFIYTPTHGDTTLEALPGSPAERPTATGFEEDAWYRPREDQSPLAYMEMIREKFSGWLLYQRADGQLNYHPDLILEHLLAQTSGAVGKYFRSATVYRSHAEAAAAGAPNQCSLADGFERSFVHPTANIVRVSGQELGGGALINVRDRAPETWTAPTTDENWIGDRRPAAVLDKMAVTRSAAWRLARLTLLQSKRRHTLRHCTVPLAPWEFANPVDLGKVVEFSGRGDHLITFMRVEGWSRGYTRTRISGEKLPSTMSRSLVAGGYPGAGA